MTLETRCFEWWFNLTRYKASKRRTPIRVFTIYLCRCGHWDLRTLLPIFERMFIGRDKYSIVRHRI